MKKIIYTVFCFVIILSCDKSKNSSVAISKDKSNVSIPDNDSVNRILLDLESNKFDTLYRKKYLFLANDFYNKKRFDVFYKISRILEKKSISIKDTLGIINAKSNIGLYYLNKFYNDSSYLYFSKAEKLSQKLDRKPCLGGILLSKSNILWSQKDFSGAEATAIKALKIAQEKNYDDDVYSSYIIIANSLIGMNKNEKALEYYNKALEKTYHIQDANYKLTFKASTYNYIAQVYQKQNQHQKAINYLEDNINFREIKEADLKTYSYIINTIAYSKFKLNDNSALPLLEEVQHIADSTKFVPTQVEVKTHLGEYYLTQKDTAKANYFLKTAQVLAHKNKIFELNNIRPNVF